MGERKRLRDWTLARVDDIRDENIATLRAIEARSARYSIYTTISKTLGILNLIVSQDIKMSVFLCLLLWSLVEVHSQTEFPYVSFMGETLPNHAFVDLTLVGYILTDEGLQCHTDLTTCCNRSSGQHRGDWYFPDGSRLLFWDDGVVIEFRKNQQVDIHRNYYNAIPPSGIYRCDIPTNAVHNDSDISVRETVYTGIYATGGIYMYM